MSMPVLPSYQFKLLNINTNYMHLLLLYKFSFCKQKANYTLFTFKLALPHNFTPAIEIFPLNPIF